MISILINNHNYGQFIGEAIASILDQDYKDFEIVVVDGISEDDSRAVIMDYVNRYPEIISAVFRNGSGQAAAINAGFAISKGDIIALLDADDCFLPGKLSRIAELHQKYDFVGTASKRTDGKDHDIPRDEPGKRQRLLKDYGFVYTYELTTSCISMSHELASRILPMPEEGYITYADAYIKVLAQYYSNIHFVNERLSLYRIHQKNTMASSADNQRMNSFLEQLYGRIHEDINRRLQERGEVLIPDMNEAKQRKAFLEANPGVAIMDGGRYAIYGIGLNSYRLMRVLKLFPIEIPFAIDGNPDKVGTEWEGVSVISPEEAAERRSEYDKILIGATFYDAISKRLEGLGLSQNKDFAGNLILNDY